MRWEDEHEYWMRKDFEGGDRGLFGGTKQT
jgi:hypothetical protein